VVTPVHVMILLYMVCSPDDMGKYGLNPVEAIVFQSDTDAPADDPWKGVLEDECEDRISVSVGVGRVP